MSAGKGWHINAGGGLVHDGPLHCTRCGTDNQQRECPDWCLRIESGCDCGSALCGHCQRNLGTSTASMGHPVH